MKIAKKLVCVHCGTPLLCFYLQSSFSDMRRGAPVRYDREALQDYIEEFGRVCWWCQHEGVDLGLGLYPYNSAIELRKVRLKDS